MKAMTRQELADRAGVDRKTLYTKPFRARRRPQALSHTPSAAALPGPTQSMINSSL